MSERRLTMVMEPALYDALLREAADRNMSSVSGAGMALLRERFGLATPAGKRDPDPAVVAQVRLLRRQGLSCTAVAKRTGVSAATVSRWSRV